VAPPTNSGVIFPGRLLVSIVTPWFSVLKVVKQYIRMSMYGSSRIYVLNSATVKSTYSRPMCIVVRLVGGDAVDRRSNVGICIVFLALATDEPTENAGLENAAPNCRGGKCGTKKVWKANQHACC